MRTNKSKPSIAFVPKGGTHPMIAVVAAPLVRRQAKSMRGSATASEMRVCDAWDTSAAPRGGRGRRSRRRGRRCWPRRWKLCRKWRRVRCGRHGVDAFLSSPTVSGCAHSALAAAVAPAARLELSRCARCAKCAPAAHSFKHANGNCKVSNLLTCLSCARPCARVFVDEYAEAVPLFPPVAE